MRKSEETSNPNSCLNKAAPEEPVFVLRANDELAPALVLNWASRYKGQKQAQVGGWTLRAQEKYAHALSLAAEMVEWQQKQGQSG